MIAKTFLMLLTLGQAAILAAFGVWFAFKAYQGWQDSRRSDEDGEPGWLIMGTLCGGACFIALVRLAYQLAINRN